MESLCVCVCGLYGMVWYGMVAVVTTSRVSRKCNEAFFWHLVVVVPYRSTDGGSCGRDTDTDILLYAVTVLTSCV
jgi:hypothetical protein